MESLNTPLIAVKREDSLKEKILARLTVPVDRKQSEIDSIMGNVEKHFEKVFPTYMDTGFKIREALLESSREHGYLLCGVSTIVKVTKDNLSFVTLLISDHSLTNLVLNSNDTLLYVSSAQGCIFEIDTVNFVTKRTFHTNFVNLGSVDYNDEENRIIGISEKNIFNIFLKEDPDECKAEVLFEGEFSSFLYSEKEWLLGDKTGKILRIDKEKNEFSVKLDAKPVKAKYSRSSNKILATLT